LQEVSSKESGFELGFSMFLAKKVFHGHSFNLCFRDFSFFKTISDSMPFAGDPPKFWQKWHFQL
jgi:hypothetical protein